MYEYWDYRVCQVVQQLNKELTLRFRKNNVVTITHIRNWLNESMCLMDEPGFCWRVDGHSIILEIQGVCHLELKVSLGVVERWDYIRECTNYYGATSVQGVSFFVSSPQGIREMLVSSLATEIHTRQKNEPVPRVVWECQKLLERKGVDEKSLVEILRTLSGLTLKERQLVSVYLGEYEVTRTKGVKWE